MNIAEIDQVEVAAVHPRGSVILALFPGHSQILSRSRGEKLGEGLVPILRHGPEMVDLVST